MKSILTLFFLFVFTSTLLAQEMEVKAAADDLRTKIISSNKKTIAVVGFTNNQGYSPDFSLYLTDSLNSILADPHQSFSMVTRTQLDKIKKERRLNISNDFDPAYAQELGKYAGANAIICGSYRVNEIQVSVNAQLLDVSNGEILGGKQFTIPKNSDIEQSLGSKNSRFEIDKQMFVETGLIGLNAIEHGRPGREEDDRLKKSIEGATSIKILMLNGQSFFSAFKPELQKFLKKSGSQMQVILAKKDSIFYREETDMALKSKLDKNGYTVNQTLIDAPKLWLFDGSTDDNKVEIRYFDTQFRLSMIIVNNESCFLTVRLSPNEPMQSIRLEFEGGAKEQQYASQCTEHFNKLWGSLLPSDNSGK